jgi:hypothetical protein
MQPYAAHYLFFLLFEDNSDDHLLIKKALNNASDFDCLSYLASQGIEKSTVYYDVNRCLKIRDKMSNPDEIGPLFDQLLDRFKRVSRKRTPASII